MSGLDAFEIGRRVEIGSHTFSAEGIIAFAKKYDPQPFHIDEQAARNSMFGALCASGWHTTAVWMRKNIDYRAIRDAELKAKGKAVPVMGPSPGIENLKWLAPVYAGDTIRFFDTVTSARRRETNPEWGIIIIHTEGFNQRDEQVVTFDNVVLVKV